MYLLMVNETREKNWNVRVKYVCIMIGEIQMKRVAQAHK